jgi:hypothetical protein
MVTTNEGKLLGVRGCGPATIDEIKRSLAHHGMGLAPDPPRLVPGAPRLPLADQRGERLASFIASRTGLGGCRTRHLGLCGRRDKSGSPVDPSAWGQIHPAFRCAACTWIHGP